MRVIAEETYDAGDAWDCSSRLAVCSRRALVAAVLIDVSDGLLALTLKECTRSFNMDKWSYNRLLSKSSPKCSEIFVIIIKWSSLCSAASITVFLMFVASAETGDWNRATSAPTQVGLTVGIYMLALLSLSEAHDADTTGCSQRFHKFMCVLSSMP